jgi:hypothetical protein
MLRAAFRVSPSDMGVSSRSWLWGLHGGSVTGVIIRADFKDVNHINQ